MKRGEIIVDAHYYNNLYAGGPFGFVEADKATASIERSQLIRRPQRQVLCPPRLINQKKKKRKTH
jgi:hypothetical protein